MRTCYLHLGSPKAGSSSIQESFQGFDSPGTRYAKLRKSNHGATLVSAFSEEPESYFEFRNSNLAGPELARYCAESRRLVDEEAKLDKDVIFSSESVPSHIGAEGLFNLVRYMRDNADRVRAIIYIRPMASLLPSMLQQRVKSGLRKFILPSPDYRKTYAPILELFERGDVQFVRFDRDDLIGGDVVTDFASRIGVEAPEIAKFVNASLTREAVAKILAFNRNTSPHIPRPLSAKVRGALAQRLRGFGSTPFEIHHDLVRSHLDQNAADIAWAEAEFGFDVCGTVKEAPDGVRGVQDLLRDG